MKIKTPELSGLALDWAVDVASGNTPIIVPFKNSKGYAVYQAQWARCQGIRSLYSSDWAQAGPLIGQARINLVSVEGEYNPQLAGTAEAFSTYWVAEVGRLRPTETYGPQGDDWGSVFQVDGYQPITGPTPLIAAMRAYVHARLGEEIEIPETLL